MRYLLTLAAAASLAACHHNSEADVGAAPQRGDTTAVKTADTTRAAVPTDTTMGQRPSATDTAAVRKDAGMKADSTGVKAADTTSAGAGAWSDTTHAAPADSTYKPKQ